MVCSGLFFSHSYTENEIPIFLSEYDLKFYWQLLGWSLKTETSIVAKTMGSSKSLICIWTDEYVDFVTDDTRTGAYL